jgi:3-hydroxybutyrate dehydrogenase
MSALKLDLSGQVAVVTGSTSGIGHALAEGLAGCGAHIVLNGLGDRDEIEALRAGIERDHGVTALYHDADMLVPDEIEDLIASTVKHFGRLDILINNAGVQHVARVEEMPAGKWDQIIAINLTSAFHTIRHAVPVMREAGRGRIVNIASAHGHAASPFKSAYVAAKHGLIGLTKTVALEVAEANITVNAISPGYVKTQLVENQIEDTAKARGISREEVVRDVMLHAQPTKKFVTEDELLGALLYLVSDQGASTHGSAILVEGGWMAQ